MFSSCLGVRDCCRFSAGSDGTTEAMGVDSRTGWSHVEGKAEGKRDTAKMRQKCKNTPGVRAEISKGIRALMTVASSVSYNKLKQTVKAGDEKATWAPVRDFV
jgi:hypothetical protein